MAGTTRGNLDEIYESTIKATRELYISAKKANSGNAVPGDQVALAIERYDRDYLRLRGCVIESVIEVLQGRSR